MPSVPKPSDRDYMLFGARIAGDFGATIAVPVVCLSLLGRWLDARYGTRPLFLIFGFAVAAVISGATLYVKAKKYGQEYEAIGKQSSKSSNKKVKDGDSADV